MFDLDSIDKELPANARIGLLICHERGDRIGSPAEGTWSCTLLPKEGGLRVVPGYAQANGTTPSIAFARAKLQWNDAVGREYLRSAPKPKRMLSPLSLKDLF